MARSTRGSEALFRVKTQADLATIATGNWQSFHAYSDTLVANTPPEDDPELGHTDRDNERDQTDPAPGLEDARGQILTALDLSQIGIWLHGLLGAPTTTGTGDLTHTFETGQLALPFLSVETQVRGDVGSTLFKQAVGVAVDGLTLGMGKTGGFRQATIDCIARSVANADATAAGTPVAPPTSRLKVPNYKGKVRIGADLDNLVLTGSLVGGDISIRNQYEAEQTVDDTAFVGQMTPGDTIVQASPRFRLHSKAILDLVPNEQTPFAIEFEWSLGSTKSLIITCGRCFAARPTPGPEGRGGIEFGLDVMAKQTTGSTPLPAAKVVLKNQTAAYFGA